MKITVIENGPIVIDTDQKISVDVGGSVELKDGPLFLCRCGESSNKPFCDSTHRKVKFAGRGAELLPE